MQSSVMFKNNYIINLHIKEDRNLSLINSYRLHCSCQINKNVAIRHKLHMFYLMEHSIQGTMYKSFEEYLTLNGIFQAQIRWTQRRIQLIHWIYFQIWFCFNSFNHSSTKGWRMYVYMYVLKDDTLNVSNFQQRLL